MQSARFFWSSIRRSRFKLISAEEITRDLGKIYENLLKLSGEKSFELVITISPHVTIGQALYRECHL